ncbi:MULTISPECIES: SH3 domain-containing protein [Marinifilum]|uniref:SH3 domain-containing protein n=1 Tax=Marinifilum TaxID=866673 RepID=UPI0027CABA0C|nr:MULTISPECIES: SH3 domain-containing protein [Marinifilum]MDQ2180308.1 SH3 domain-containing protein [Marinifilum sp. D714]
MKNKEILSKYKKQIISVIGFVFLLFLANGLFAEKYEVNASALNIRAQPRSSSLIMGKLKKGDVVNLRSQQNGWGEILNKRDVGYVRLEYLNKVPVTPPIKQTKEVKKVAVSEFDMMAKAIGIMVVLLGLLLFLPDKKQIVMTRYCLLLLVFILEIIYSFFVDGAFSFLKYSFFNDGLNRLFVVLFRLIGLVIILGVQLFTYIKLIQYCQSKTGRVNYELYVRSCQFLIPATIILYLINADVLIWFFYAGIGYVLFKHVSGIFVVSKNNITIGWLHLVLVIVGTVGLFTMMFEIVRAAIVVALALIVIYGMLAAGASTATSGNFDSNNDSYDNGNYEDEKLVVNENGSERVLEDTGFGTYRDDRGDDWEDAGFGNVRRSD